MLNRAWRQPMTNSDEKPQRSGWIDSDISDYETRRLHGQPLFDEAGLSPGAVANKLGISRQAVHDAINRGKLKAIRILEPHNNNLLAILIPHSEFLRYRIARNHR